MARGFRRSSNCELASSLPPASERSPNISGFCSGSLVLNFSRVSVGVVMCRFLNHRSTQLTKLLKNALGGNSLAIMICCVTPAANDETLSTLRVSTLHVYSLLHCAKLSGTVYCYRFCL